MLDRYINRVLGRLSVPKMQNSTNLRLKRAIDEPVSRNVRIQVLMAFYKDEFAPKKEKSRSFKNQSC